mmetsp:Transcript_3689/g.7060  ORF Transcript_3689/g.7060 Transcript_3689/m.7060 type:complete len:86 (-) Transcript_3689:474-731(-)
MRQSHGNPGETIEALPLAHIEEMVEEVDIVEVTKQEATQAPSSLGRCMMEIGEVVDTDTKDVIMPLRRAEGGVSFRSRTDGNHVT